MPGQVELGAVRVDDVVHVEVTQSVPFFRSLLQFQFSHSFLESQEFIGGQVADFLSYRLCSTPGKNTRVNILLAVTLIM